MRKVMQQIVRTPLLALLVTVLVCSMFALGIAPTYAHTLKQTHTAETTYECGTGTSGHCYGQVNWFGPSGSHLGGVQTDILVVPIGCDNINPADGSCGGLFLTNEIWMVDNTSSQKQYCLNQVCWIEAGYLLGGTYQSACDYGFSGEPCYFWADSRPHGGFYDHYNSIPADNVGHHTRFKFKWLGNGSWDVSVNPLASSDGYWDSTSTSNTIYPQNETLGEELAGATSSASDGLYTSNSADWINNKWADANENFYYQTGCSSNCTAGSTGGSAPPPYGDWGTVPNCCNNGGVWLAYTPQGS